MENRRMFFKGLAAFVTGVVGAKVSSYVPKEKETMMVTNTMTIKGPDGEDYHPVVVKKHKIDETTIEEQVISHGTFKFHTTAPKNQVRELKA